jgi:hypothetical protein
MVRNILEYGKSSRSSGLNIVMLNTIEGPDEFVTGGVTVKDEFKFLPL